MFRMVSVGTVVAVAIAVATAGAAAPAVAAAGSRPAAARAASHDDEFHGVSCTSAKGCLAVGSWFSSNAKKLYALGETRSPGHSTWVIHDPARISGAASTGFGPLGNGETVSCASAPSAVCIGIGSYNKPTGQFNYAAKWNWKSWKIVNPPDPSPTNSSGLDAVTCRSSAFCIAVGHWFNTAKHKYELESLIWDGRSWALKPVPPVPAQATTPRLWGISCVSRTWCMAVGDYDVGPAQPTLSEIWNGNSWKMHLPRNPAGRADNSLLGVSCVSTTFCNAAGDSLTSKLSLLSLGEAWNGKSWTVKPTPSGTQEIGSALFDVSCLSRTFCLTVGTLAARWNGTSWKSAHFPQPSGSSLTNATSIACSSTSNCTAVGDYSSTSGTKTVVMSWNGKSFALQTAQNP
jgi:hypothetical protein